MTRLDFSLNTFELSNQGKEVGRALTMPLRVCHPVPVCLKAEATPQVLAAGPKQAALDAAKALPFLRGMAGSLVQLLVEGCHVGALPNIGLCTGLEHLALVLLPQSPGPGVHVPVQLAGLAPCTRLRRLRLGRALLQPAAEQLQVLADMPGLQELELERCSGGSGGKPLDSVPWAAFPSLRAVSLDSCPLGAQALEGMPRCTRLRSLLLRDTAVSRALLEPLAGARLRRLGVAHSKTVSAPQPLLTAELLMTLPDLREVAVENTENAVADPAGLFSSSGSLQRVSLTECKVRGSSFAAATGLQVSEQAVQRLHLPAFGPNRQKQRSWVFRYAPV